MKKLFPTAPISTPSHLTFPASIKAIRPKRYALIAIVLLAGCAVLDTHQAKLDQKQLREVLMDYNQDQILDNLIRARNGLPIVHYDLSHITAAVTSKFVPTVGGGRLATDVQTRTPTHTTVTTDQTTTASTGLTVMNTVAKTVSVVGGLVETVAKPFNYNINAEGDNAISVEAIPVLDKPEVYAAYISFLNTGITHKQREEKEDEKEDEDVTKITTVETGPTKVTTTTVAPSNATTTETKESVQTTTTTTEKAPNAPSTPVPITKETLDFRCAKSLVRSSKPPTMAVLVGPKRWRDGMYYWVTIRI